MDVPVPAAARGRIAPATVALIAITSTTMPTVQAAEAPVARGDVARTNAVTQVQVRVVDNDFDLDGDSFSVVEVATPANGSALIAGGGTHVSYTPPAGFSGVETISYTIRDSRGCRRSGRWRCGSTRVLSSVGVSPDANTDYRYVYQGSSVGFTAAHLVANDSDPQGQALTCGGGVGTVQRRSVDRVVERRVRLCRPTARPTWSAPIINSTISSPTPTAMSPRGSS